MRELLVYPVGDKYVVLGGNMRLRACLSLGYSELPCKVIPRDTPAEKLRAIVMQDNNQYGDTDWDSIANEWDLDELKDWGVEMPKEWDITTNDYNEEDDDEIERREREFKERMATGEISEDDEEYQEFLEKFKLKKTTDDCYTPEIIYNAVAKWVEKKYKANRKYFVRPFYPGGDYKKQKYQKGDIVVDNPPFSILSEIIRFYVDRKIQFFLFAPHLTLFSSASTSVCALCVGAQVTYENGANVNTSFITNMEDSNIQFKSEPSLYKDVSDANNENLKQHKKELPKYSYDKHVIMTPLLSSFSRFGIDFSVSVNECKRISALDSQKASKKGIFGSGYLVSDRVVVEREKAERLKAEREKAEREKAERWELSERELNVIKELNK